MIDIRTYSTYTLEFRAANNTWIPDYFSFNTDADCIEAYFSEPANSRSIHDVRIKREKHTVSITHQPLLEAYNDRLNTE